MLKNSDGIALETVKNKADGSITFNPIEYKEDVGVEGKTYTYTISEVIGTNPSITYDRNDIIVNVNVTKNIDNDLVAQVVYKKEGQDVTANPTFVNTYTAPKPAKANFTVTKEYNDSEGEARAIEANQFRFMLTGQNGAPMPDDVLTGNTKTVNSSGSQTGVESISFGNITYDSEGEYRYTIEEIKGADPSISYDKEQISVIVNVSKNRENVLVAETTYIDETFTTNPTFNNVYTKPDPIKAVLEINKNYVDSEGKEKAFGQNVFSFEIEAENNAPLPRHTVVQTADSTKSFEKMYFEEIEYTEDVGLSGKTYSYIIKEKIPVNGKDAIWNPSVTYSKSKIKAEVTIIKDINNDLQVDKIEYFKEDGTKIDADPTIENIYNAPKPAELELTANKSFITPDGQPFDFGGNIFEFEVEPQNGAPAPKHMTASTSMQDQAGETVSFGKITFNEDTGIAAGTRKTYEYIVREKEGANPSVEYDGREVKVTVTVTKNEQNELEAVANYEEAGEPAQGVEFVNKYHKPKPTEKELSVTKNFATDEGEPFDFGGNVFRFKIEPQDGAPAPEKLEIETTGSDVSTEELSFGIIEFTEDVGLTAGSYKDYVYKITEIAGDNPSVTYDPKTVTATVRVTKDDDNKLNAEVTYTVDGAKVEKAEFDNVYTLPKPTEEELFVTKNFATDEGEPFDFGGNVFRFKIEPQDGAPAPEKLEIETTGSDVSTEELSFGIIEFTEDVGLTAGSYKDYVYKITEIEGENPSVTYDPKTVTATVRVTKDDDNKLNAEVTYTVDGAKVEKAEFDNVYTLPKPVDTELLVSKWLRDAAENEINFGDSIFEFEIEPQGEAPAPENLTVATDATDAALQELSFGRIHFDKDVGLTAGAEQVYTYIIREIAGDNPSVTYNTAEVTAEITVTKTDENKLAIASIEYFDEEGALIAEGEGQSAVVENLYTAPEPSEIAFELKKIYEGHELAGGDFEFELVDEDGNVLQTVTNDATGHVAFAPVIFDEDPGKATLSYGFTIREKNLENPSITYDGEEISIVVEISKTGDNVLESVVTYTKSAEDVTLEPYFRNSYTAPEPVEAVIQLHKTYMNGELYGNDCDSMN